VKVSNSQLSAYKDCPQKWEYSYVHSYKPLARRRTFDKGNYTHELMHVLYQLMQDSHHEPGSDFLQAAIHQRIMGDLENAAKDNLAVYASIIKVMTSYVQYRSPLIDRQIKIEGVEATLEVEAQTPKGHTVILLAIVDLVYRDLRGRMVVRDHKTSEKANSWNKEKVRLDPQLLLYAAIWYKLTGEVPVTEINFALTHDYKTPKPPREMFNLFRIEHTQAVLERFWDETLMLIDQMIESPVVPHYGNCQYCAFRELCDSRLKGISAENILKSNFEVVPRDYTIKRRSGLSSENSEGNPQRAFHLDLSNLG
jgi:CRISPR/Cas system-associated exonuclease Cas4 (RecB family)